MIAVGGPRRWAWAEIDLTAIEHNVRVISDAVAPAGPLIAIVCTGLAGASRPPTAYPMPNNTVAAIAIAATVV